ncbi:hypothetical protein U1Q18_027226, partial [Sarracenia purpurea var. burkii]
IQSSCRFSYSFTDAVISREKPSFSGYCLFDGIKRRASFLQIGCSFVEQGLKPKPLHKPSKINLDTEKETRSDVARIRSPSSGLCDQIEKLVLYRSYQEALELFEILEYEGNYDVTVSTYDALVNACISLKSIRGVKKRNLVSWNTIIGGLVESGDYVEAFRLFLVMWEEFSDAGSRTFALMIRASAGLELAFPGRQLHSCALKMGVGGDIFVSCALIDMYSYALHGYSEEALEMYYEMQDSGVKMDHFTFSIIIRVCARLASLEHAKQAHAGLVRHGFGLDIVANTALVDFYSKWGRIEDARNVFDKMPHKNVISWNALIAGYGNHGRGIEAVELFEKMLQERVIPNHVTFLAVLSACSYSGLSDRGWAIFESMRRVHKVKPRAMHYACMIELLGREGLLDEAFALIRDAPFHPTVNMWAALLTACRFHKNLVLGKFAAEKIYGMEPEKLSNYVVLLNIYNSTRRVGGVRQE